jgi:hypothetical protein
MGMEMRMVVRGIRGVGRRHGRWERAAVLAACGLILAQARASQSRPAEPPLRVIVDPRVELLSILFRLAGSPEYNMGRVASYVKDVDDHFGPYRYYPAVEMARKLRQTRGVGFDACMILAVHVTDAYTLKEKVPFDPPPEIFGPRWPPAEAREFLEKARGFVKDTRFEEFIRDHQRLYRVAVSRIQELVRTHGHLEWFPEFFGARPQASFTVAVGLLNGGGSYGPHCRTADGKEELYCILGVWKTDAKGLPQFDRDMLDVVIHEFCHSYSNPIVARHLGELQGAGGKIYPRVAAHMMGQAYGSWQAMMYESLVRACVVRYSYNYEGPVAARLAVEEEKRRRFLWIQELSDLLGQYETQRDRYPTLDSFMPRIVAFFNQYADTFLEQMEEAPGKEPRIVSMTPANEASNVDPDLAAIRIVFDRPMKAGSCSITGEDPHLPEVTGNARYDAERKVLTIPVKLTPNRSYEFTLNSGKSRDIQSHKGVSLPPVRVRFTTGERRGWQRE